MCNATHHVLLSLGSNEDALVRLTRATSLLALLLTDMEATAIVTSADASGKGCADYGNRLVTGHTQLAQRELVTRLKAIERSCGRRQELKERGIVGMDIDLMAYDNERMKPADWQQDYVKQLLKTLNIKP